MDAYHGALGFLLRPTRMVRSACAAAVSSRARVELSFELEAYGFGAIVEIRNGSHLYIQVRVSQAATDTATLSVARRDLWVDV